MAKLTVRESLRPTVKGSEGIAPAPSQHIMNVGTADSRYGYSVANSFGTLTPDNIDGQLVYNCASGPSISTFYLTFGAAGDEQLEDATELVVTWGTYGDVTYTWSPAQTEYEVENQTALLTYLQGEVGNDIAIDFVVLK